jgi:hypothetical protein
MEASMRAILRDSGTARRIRVIWLLSAAYLILGINDLEGQDKPLIPAAPFELLGRPTNINVLVSNSGELSINDQPVPWNRLETELKAIYSGRSERILFIRATADVRGDLLSRLLRAARRNDVTVYLVPM